MTTSLMQASLRELWIVGSSILLGAGLCHIVILYATKWVSCLIIQSRRQRDRLTYFSSRQYQQDCVGKKKSTAAHFSAIIRQDHRGLINDLLPWVELPIKTSWTSDEQRQALLDIFHAGHNSNKRSTYFGSETFELDVFSANLFGWKRIEGRPTVYFGEIACLQDTTAGVKMRFFLHPQDAKMVVMSGWGKVIDTAKQPRFPNITQHDEGVQVQLFAPRNSTEADQVTKVVLDASIWWKAGFDNEETV